MKLRTCQCYLIYLHVWACITNDKHICTCLQLCVLPICWYIYHPFHAGFLRGSSYIAIGFAPEVVVPIALRVGDLPRGVILDIVRKLYVK